MFKLRTRALEDLQNMRYGYLWWALDSEDEIYSAIGNSGNILYIDAKNNLVISIISYFKPMIIDRVGFVEEYLNPFILKQPILK